MKTYTNLKKKINKKDAIITVMGLGYVGLPMALRFSEKGYEVNAYDTSKHRIDRLKKGVAYINDVTPDRIKKALKRRNFHPTTDAKALNQADAIIICVPTPLRKVKDPDMSYIISASKTLKEQIRSGQVIILESTTYPGTTREVILPRLEKSGLKLDEDFFLAFSPERIDPGNPKYDFTNIPKVLGGMTKKSTELGKALYSKAIKRVVGVSTTEAAEVTKLLENTFRIVNLGLINEFASLCHKLNIDVWEVIKAANTKPFGFMPFYPGPGVGGHCIPADPMYLSWKAHTIGFDTKMIDLAAWVNRNVPHHIVKRAEELLKDRKKKLKGAKVFVVGVTYKKDVNDLRESPSIEIIKILQKKKCNVSYHDPLIPYLNVPGIKMRSSKLTPAALKKQDIVLLITDHSDLDYKMIAKSSKIIFDTRNIFEANGISGENIVKL